MTCFISNILIKSLFLVEPVSFQHDAGFDAYMAGYGSYSVLSLVTMNLIFNSSFHTYGSRFDCNYNEKPTRPTLME